MSLPLYAVRFSTRAAKVLAALPEHAVEAVWDLLDAAAADPGGFGQWDTVYLDGEDVRIASSGRLSVRPFGRDLPLPVAGARCWAVAHERWALRLQRVGRAHRVGEHDAAGRLRTALLVGKNPDENTFDESGLPGDLALVLQLGRLVHYAETAWASQSPADQQASRDVAAAEVEGLRRVMDFIKTETMPDLRRRRSVAARRVQRFYSTQTEAARSMGLDRARGRP